MEKTEIKRERNIMNCHKCKEPLDASAQGEVLEAAHDASIIEVRVRCKCGHLHYTFFPATELVSDTQLVLR